MTAGTESDKLFAQETGNIKADDGLLASLASAIRPHLRPHLRPMKLSRNVPECRHVREKIQVLGIAPIGLSRVLGFVMTSGRSSIVSAILAQWAFERRRFLEKWCRSGSHFTMGLMGR